MKFIRTEASMVDRSSGTAAAKTTALLVRVGLSLLMAMPAVVAQVAGEWDGGEAFGRMVLGQSGPSVGGNFEVSDGRIFASFKDNILEGLWTQATADQRCSQAAFDGRYYWGHIKLRFTGNTFTGGWSYCDTPAALDGSAVGTRLPAAGTPPETPDPAPTSSVPAKGSKTSSKATAPVKNEKAPKDYLKNVGGGLNMFSPEQETEMGLNTSTQMNQHLSLVGDESVQSYVESLGQRLVAASRRPDLQCRFFVVNTREVNAFALPGCFVYVNRALIEMSQNEGQLAGVIGHEIGHVIGRHGAKQLSKQLLILGLVAGASEAARSKSEELAETIATVGGFGAMLAKLKYTRDDEHQADALGVETLAAAGYDPGALADFFRLMDPGSRLDKSSRILGILDTHPVTADREKILSSLVAQVASHGNAEAEGAEAYQNCRVKMANWPAPSADGDVTLANALAATGGPAK
jgi:Zn-dependent protease with chaperone function